MEAVEAADVREEMSGESDTTQSNPHIHSPVEDLHQAEAAAAAICTIFINLGTTALGVALSACRHKYQVNGTAGSSVWEPFEDAWVGGARHSPVDNFLERALSGPPRRHGASVDLVELSRPACPSVTLDFGGGISRTPAAAAALRVLRCTGDLPAAKQQP
ncbi:unnamed protein product [Boreogadus saida]